MGFEWDENKRAANLERHGVDFADAVGALLDPFSITREDPDAEAEARFLTLGCGFAGTVLLVVWTERDQDAIRIISARAASPGEARCYRGGIG
ncbi:MAG: BrnT family toxin [Xanthomonadaceae bacterium]|jgi:uncharacterized DUF497 family protein|nr:BrnT family toxin [Xanthomonadaceae bacterium]